MNFDIANRTIFLTVSGSQAYGMATPESDWDYRGIAIPPLNSYIGIKDKFQQFVDSDKGKHVYTHFPVGLLKTDPRMEGADPNEAPDMQVYELTKFIGLAVQGNPSIMEVLFTDPRFFVQKDPIFDKILDIKEKFITRACKARFSGYALSQLQRIRRHRRWLTNPPTHKPTRNEFGLPEHGGLLSQDQIGAAESLIRAQVNEFMIDQTHLPEDLKIEFKSQMVRSMKIIWAILNKDSKFPIGDNQQHEHLDDALYWAAAEEQGFSGNFIIILQKEKQYRQAKKEWDSYQKWLRDRNPKRAAIEAKLGYDAKHASHLVRLLRMAREILETGQVNVWRPDAKELLSIREGAMSYEEVVEFAEREDEALNEIVKKSSLPKHAPVNEIHDVVFNIVMEFSSKWSWDLNQNELEKVIKSIRANVQD